MEFHSKKLKNTISKCNPTKIYTVRTGYNFSFHTISLQNDGGCVPSTFATRRVAGWLTDRQNQRKIAPLVQAAGPAPVSPAQRHPHLTLCSTFLKALKDSKHLIKDLKDSKHLTTSKL